MYKDEISKAKPIPSYAWSLSDALFITSKPTCPSAHHPYLDTKVSPVESYFLLLESKDPSNPRPQIG